ncbi:MAG: sigma-70 family RNA polymerase sigma factor [Pirellulales bacterium]|nr:sigma-70 family RNA polymerase sigma factor [Pirellulales bacterium]
MDLQPANGRPAPPGDLLSRARDGDADALGQLLDGFRGYLLAVAHRELDGGLRARLGPSDLVQETFLRSQRALANFAGANQEELRAWLAQILVNRCRDLRDEHVLTAKRAIHREVPLEADGSAIGPVNGLAADTLTPSGHAIADEELAGLMTALTQLPDECRQVVWLRNWEGLTFDEVGRRTGRSAEAARKVFSRGVRQLAELLEPSDATSSLGSL